MKQFTDLDHKQLIDMLRKVVATVEKVQPDRVFITRMNYSISASEGVKPDVNIVAAITQGNLKEVGYTMRWNARKECFDSIRYIYRKFDTYKIRCENGTYSPLYQRVTDEYIDFAICHLLRELGFRKRTWDYFVKAKGEKPKLFKNSRKDYNGYYRYTPNLGKSSFQEYDKAGYLCAAPTHQQISAFCRANGIHLYEELYESFDKQDLLRKLIKEYRKRTGFSDAFRRYAHDI